MVEAILYKTENPDLFKLVDKKTGKPVELEIPVGGKKQILKVKEYVSKMDIHDLKHYGFVIDDSQL